MIEAARVHHLARRRGGVATIGGGADSAYGTDLDDTSLHVHDLAFC